MIRRIVFLGAPGVGKGTQAKLLQEQMGVKHLSTGDMIRQAIAEQTLIGNKVAAIVKAGKLVDDHDVVAVVQSVLQSGPKLMAKSGFIFDGFPRTLVQAKALKGLLGSDYPVTHAVSFNVPQSSLVMRLAGRYACKQCGEIYHRVFRQPTRENTCDSCGSDKFVIRDDDRPEVVKNRLKIFADEMDPILDFYHRDGILCKLDADGDVTDVTQRLLQLL